jgi:hypothetical protein
MFNRARVAAILLLATMAIPQESALAANWWPAAVEDALAKAGDNRDELVTALAEVPAEQRDGLQFLVRHMPPRDLATLGSEFLLENTEYAYKVRKETTWGAQLPLDIFLNDVLPYANLNEQRDRWRKDFYEKFMPVVKGCSSAADAAQRLNERMFKMLGVRYSTKRNRAEQGPHESIRTGLASCTGLSIVLSDACRAVGVPARVAGIPNWVNKRGNHTWVEVWDGQWHFTGAAEPSSQGLNHTWFQHDASLALVDNPRHAIYATSFRPTGLVFPMVWARHDDGIPAVNVTARYANNDEGKRGPSTRLLVRVFQADGRTRASARVEVEPFEVEPPADSQKHSGTSRDESFDTNDILAFELPRKRQFKVSIDDDGDVQTREIDTADHEQLLVDFQLAPVAQ